MGRALPRGHHGEPHAGWPRRDPLARVIMPSGRIKRMKGLALPIPHTRTALPPRLHRMIEWITGEFSWLERLEFCSALIAAAVKQGVVVGSGDVAGAPAP